MRLLLIPALLLSAACSTAASAPGTGEPASPEARRLRDEALAAARVWAPPAVPVAQVDLRSNPGADPRFDPGQDLWCRFTLNDVGGTTPKFYCQLADGERVKVKYGAANPELQAEVAASRLLNALGFGADRMFVVRRVRCAGCPRFPFTSLRCYQRTGSTSACFPGGIDEQSVIDFDVAVVERRIPGRVIESFDSEGWAWFELERIDAARGGSPRAHVDAFRLMARLLAHWDNKAPNQRLICPPGKDMPTGGCAEPFAIMQDVGATFGPLKIDLANWQRDRIWKNASACMISMKHMPWGGGTFPDIEVSEEGRRMLLGLLEQLSVDQLRGLFEGSRITAHDQMSASARSADAWIQAFLDKVAQVRAAGPCPS